MEWGAFSLVFLLLFSAMTMAASSKLPFVGFKVEFVKHDIPTEMTGGQTVSANVMIKNASSKTWPSKPDPKGKQRRKSFVSVA